MWTRITVYPDRVEICKPFGISKRVIPAKQIAAVVVSPLFGTAAIETSGGAAFGVNIGWRTNLYKFEEAVRGLIAH